MLERRPPLPGDVLTTSCFWVFHYQHLEPVTEQMPRLALLRAAAICSLGLKEGEPKLCLAIRFAGSALDDGPRSILPLSPSHFSGRGRQNSMRKLLHGQMGSSSTWGTPSPLLLSPRSLQSCFSHFSPYPLQPGGVFPVLTPAVSGEGQPQQHLGTSSQHIMEELLHFRALPDQTWQNRLL